MKHVVILEQSIMLNTTQWNKVLTELGYSAAYWPLVKFIEITVDEIKVTPS